MVWSRRRWAEKLGVVLGIDWQFFVILAWTLSLAVGSLIAVRSLRFWASILVAIGSVVSALGVITIVGFEGLEAWARYRGRPGMNYDVVGVIAGLSILGGLVLFVIGFLGIAARYGIMLRRTGELESLAEALQVRISERGS